jgi:shikimate kinase
MRLFVLGHRGVGKTTLGAAWAARQGWRHLDSDQELARQAGMPSVRHLAQQVGQSAFREREALWLEQQISCLSSGPCLISLGGGIVEHEGAWMRLQTLPTIVLWLPPEIQQRRWQEKGMPAWSASYHPAQVEAAWLHREQRLRTLPGEHCELVGDFERDLQRLSTTITQYQRRG